MEDKYLKYRKVLDKLKKTEPVLDDAEALVDRIMHSVEESTSHSGRIRMMRILGSMSGIAAAALICLFAYETLKYSLSSEDNLSGAQPVNAAKTMYLHNLGGLNNKEKEEIIKNILKNREAQRARKERLSAAFITHNRKITHNREKSKLSSSYN